ncbi:MAG: hypothetical protein QXP54_05095, partial [Thermofilum sp.]
APGRVVPALEEKLARPLHSLRHRVRLVEELASSKGMRELGARRKELSFDEELNKVLEEALTP